MFLKIEERNWLCYKIKMEDKRLSVRSGNKEVPCSLSQTPDGPLLPRTCSHKTNKVRKAQKWKAWPPTQWTSSDPGSKKNYRKEQYLSNRWTIIQWNTKQSNPWQERWNTEQQKKWGDNGSRPMSNNINNHIKMKWPKTHQLEDWDCWTGITTERPNSRL